MLKNTLTEYCKNELIPNPYDLCNNIIDSIISNLYKFPFIQIWENISRNLVNIYGILSDTRLISNEELTILKSKLLNESIQLNKLSLNNSLDNNTIYIVFSLYFNKVDYYRIPKIKNSTDEGFFSSKGIDLDYINYFESKPTVHKFYMSLLNNIGGWDIMQEFNMLNKEQLLDLVYKLNSKMVEYDLHHETLYIVGGYVCLLNNDKQATCDIDYYCKNDITNIKQLAYDIGIQNNALGWLSDMYSLAKHGYCASLDDLLSIDDSFYEYMTLSKLTLYVQTDKCILFTKLNAGRDKDIQDIKSILSRLNITTNTQLHNIIKEYLVLSSAKLQIINESITKLTLD